MKEEKQKPKYLEWMIEEARQKILKHPDLVAYTQNSIKKDVFVRILKVSEEKFDKYMKKEYLGYEVETAPLELLHPILYAYVRLEIWELELFYRFKTAIEYHINRPMQCVQKIYNLKQMWFEKEHYNGLLMTCQIYKFTLADILDLVRKKQIEGFQFVRSFLFKSYLSILYALNNPKAATLCLSFSYDPKNIFIDQFFRIMLGNPIYGAGNPKPLLAYENEKNERSINGRICQQIMAVFDEIMKYNELMEIISLKNDIVHRFFSRKREYIRLSEEIVDIEKYLETYQFLVFEFPDEVILTYLRDVEVKLANNNQRVKLQLDQLEKSRQHLAIVSQQYP